MYTPRPILEGGRGILEFESGKGRGEGSLEVTRLEFGLGALS